MKKVTSKILTLIWLLAISVLLAPTASNAAPDLVNYQGIILDGGGSPVPNADQAMTFRVYDAESLGTPLWEEDQTVPTVNGVYNVFLGAGTTITGTFDPSLFASDSRWLEVVVNGETLTPRQRITSVPFALRAAEVDYAATAGNAATLDGIDSAALEESAEIDSDVAAHAGNASAHHVKTTNFTALAGEVSTGQIPSEITRDSEVGTAVSAHDSAASAHSALQDRVTGTCSAGSSIRIVNANGTVTCQTSGNGDITAVTAGTGLNGSTLSGNAKINMDVPLTLSANSTTHIIKATNSSTANLDIAIHGVMSATSGGGSSAAVRGESMSTTGNGIGVFGSHDGSGWGVYGEAQSGRALYGYTNSGVAGYFSTSSGTAGHFYSDTGYGLLVPKGNVGIGLDNPTSKFVVAGTADGYLGVFDNGNSNSGQDSSGIFVKADAYYGLTGLSRGGYFYARGGQNGGKAYGIQTSANANGTGASYGVYSDADGGSTTGREWAFYGLGDGYFSGEVGVGTSPNTKLHVNGDSTSGAFRAQINGATKFYVAANGNVVIGANDSIPNTRLQVSGGVDASMSASSGYMMIGGETGDNIVMDTNEIIARSNGAPAKLFLNLGSSFVVVPGLEIIGGADLAEPFDFNDTEGIEPGMVVAIDKHNPGQLRIADSAYDRTVAGIISGANGINAGLTLNQQGSIADGSYPVALTGRVYAWADATENPIEAGDLLTTSNTPGHLMKVTDYPNAQGAILGKAMTTLDEGKGMVLVLVSLQ